MRERRLEEPKDILMRTKDFRFYVLRVAEIGVNEMLHGWLK